MLWDTTTPTTSKAPHAHQYYYTGAYPKLKYPNRNYTNAQILSDEPTKFVYLCNYDLRFGPRGPLVDYFCDRYTNKQFFVKTGSYTCRVVAPQYLTRGEEFLEG